MFSSAFFSFSSQLSHHCSERFFVFIAANQNFLWHHTRAPTSGSSPFPFPRLQISLYCVLHLFCTFVCARARVSRPTTAGAFRHFKSHQITPVYQKRLFHHHRCVVVVTTSAAAAAASSSVSLASSSSLLSSSLFIILITRLYHLTCFLSLTKYEYHPHTHTRVLLFMYTKPPTRTHACTHTYTYI